MARLTIDAVLSGGAFPGKFAICGNCGETLCPRDKVTVGSPWYRRGYVHVLRWAPEWRLVLAAVADEPPYLERSARSRRPAAPSSPTAQYIKYGPPDPLALCPGCGELNRMDPRTLHVQAL